MASRDSREESSERSWCSAKEQGSSTGNRCSTSVNYLIDLFRGQYRPASSSGSSVNFRHLAEQPSLRQIRMLITGIRWSEAAFIRRMPPLFASSLYTRWVSQPERKKRRDHPGFTRLSYGRFRLLSHGDTRLVTPVWRMIGSRCAYVHRDLRLNDTLDLWTQPVHRNPWVNVKRR